MYLYLLRHGQSEGNIVKHDVPDAKLTPLGHQQAEELARRLAGEGLDLLISSPLRRALQTITPLRRLTGAPLEVWQHTGEFRSIAPAPFLGRREVLEFCPDAICSSDFPEATWEFGDETLESTNARARAVVDTLRSRFAETNMKIAMVNHGAFMNFMFMALIGLDFDRYFAFDVHNCSITRILIEPGRVRVHSLNEVAHLSSIT